MVKNVDLLILHRQALIRIPLRIFDDRSVPAVRMITAVWIRLCFNDGAIRFASYTKGRTLADVLNEWLEVYCIHLRPNALADMKTAVQIHIVPHIGNVPLENVTTGMIQRLYNDMMKRVWKPAVYKEINGLKVEVSPAKTYSAKTVRNVHSALKQALDQAVRTNLIAKNPCDYVQLPKKESIEYVIPTSEQLGTLLKALEKYDTYYAILTCAVLGCRRGEALGLQWQDIDFMQNTVSLKRAYIYN